MQWKKLWSIYFSRDPKIRTTRWLSPSQVRRQAFRALVAKGNDPPFSDTFIDRLSENLAKNERMFWTLTLINLGMYVLLLANLYGVSFQLRLFDTEIGPNFPIREILLLASSVLGLSVFVLGRETDDLRNMIDAYLEIKSPAAVYPFLRHKYRRLLGTFPAFRYKFGEHTAPGVAQLLLIFLALILLLVGIFCLVLLLIAIHALIIWRMWHDPRLPWILNHLIIFIVVCFDLFAFMFTVFLVVPLPVYDFTPLFKTQSEKALAQSEKQAET